eukprot:INCI5864.18.p1 GENE.INCI5864.18~~INCI5864.18.p1  ORF type:complete len:3168 (+),score=718.64 INCI5864.18:265-9768(+)
MGGAASIQELGEDIEGIDDGEMSSKMQTVLDSLKKKGMALTEENFQNEAKVGLNEKDFERAVAMADKVKSRFESKMNATGAGGAGGSPLGGKKKRKKKRKKKAGATDQVPVTVAEDYDVITGLRASVTKVKGFRDAVKKFIGALEMDTVLNADDLIQEQLSAVKKAAVTKRAEKNGIVIELLGEVGCKKQTNADGSMLYQWGDGTLIKHSDDVYVMKLPSGNVVQYNEKEQVKIFQNPDGIILQVQGSSDVVNIHDGSENEYMSKPSGKICAIEPIEEGEGYRLQYNGAGKKKSRYTMYTECTDDDSPTLVLFDDGLYVVTYPSGDTLQRHPDGSYLHIDPKGRKDGRSANGDKGANTIPTLTARVPKDLSEKWIGSIQEDISPEQYVVEQAIDVFVDSDKPGGIPADVDIGVEEMLKILDELASVPTSKGEKRYYESLYNRIWRQKNGFVKASNVVAVIKQAKLASERIVFLLAAYITTVHETITSEDRPDRDTFARDWADNVKSRDMIIIMRATLCAVVGSIHPSDEVEGLPLLLLDTKEISTSFHSRHEVTSEDQGPTGKTIKMRSLAGLLTLQEQDLYIPMFGMLDVDGDGMLELASVLKVVECSGLSSSTQVKILNLCIQGDAWREINAVEFVKAMQLAAVAQEGENVCQDVYETIVDLVDELDCLAQIELCRILDPIPPPSDLLPVVSKIIAKILKFYNKEKVPGFNNKLKILAHLETIPLRPAEVELSVALYRRIVRMNGGRPTLHELVHQLQHTKLSSLDIINAVAVSVVFTAQDMRVTTLRSAHVEVATQEVMERAFRLLACAQHGKGKSLKSLTLKETKTFSKIPLIILRARKVGGAIIDIVPGLDEEEREFLSPRYEAIDVYGDDDCPSVLVANDLQRVKGLSDSDCRNVFDTICAAFQDDGHSISYRQYCLIMKLGAMIQHGDSISIGMAKQLDSEGSPGDPPALTRIPRPIGDWFAYMSDSSGSEDDETDDSDESASDEAPDDMLSGSESSSLELSESEDDDEADPTRPRRGRDDADSPSVTVLSGLQAAHIFGKPREMDGGEGKRSPSSKSNASEHNFEEVVEVQGTLQLSGLQPSAMDQSTATGVKLRSAIKNAIVDAAGIDTTTGKRNASDEKYKVKIKVQQDGLRSKVRYKLVLAGSRDAMLRSKARVKDTLKARDSSVAGHNRSDGAPDADVSDDMLGSLIKKHAQRRGVADAVTASAIQNVRDNPESSVRVSGALALNAGLSMRELAADNGDCLIEPIRAAFLQAVADLPDVKIHGDGLQAVLTQGSTSDSVCLSYEFTASSANVGPKTSGRKAAMRNTKAAQAAGDKLNEVIAAAAEQHAHRDEGSLAEQLVAVVRGLSSQASATDDQNGLGLSVLQQTVHSTVAADAVDNVTFSLNGSVKVRANGLDAAELRPPAPGGLGLAKMISQPPPNVDTTGLRITCNINAAKNTKEPGCVKANYTVKVTGPEVKAKLCIEAMAKALEKLQRQAQAAKDGDKDAAAAADDTLAVQSNAISRYAAELSDEPFLREFSVESFQAIETTQAEEATPATLGGGAGPTADYDSTIGSGGLLPGGAEPAVAGSAGAGKGSGTPRGVTANTAVLKGSFALSGCPRSMVDGRSAEFVAAVQAGLEQVLASDDSVREAVESGAYTHRIKVTGVQSATSSSDHGDHGDHSESGGLNTSTEVSYVVELQRNDASEASANSPSKKKASGDATWDFVRLANDSSSVGKPSRSGRGMSSANLDLAAVVASARGSLAKALPAGLGHSGGDGDDTSGVAPVAAESQSFVDHMSAQFAAVHPDLSSASQLLSDLPIRVRATPTAISDAKSYRKVIASGSSSSSSAHASADLSTAVEFGTAPSGSLAQRKRRSAKDRKKTAGPNDAPVRMVSMTTETIVDGAIGGHSASALADANSAARQSTCRAVELAMQDVLAEAAEEMARNDPDFNPQDVRYLSRVVAFRRAGGVGDSASAARGEGSSSACRLTVQTLVDHPSSKAARAFSKVAKKAVDAALAEPNSGRKGKHRRSLAFSEEVHRIATAFAVHDDVTKTATKPMGNTTASFSVAPSGGTVVGAVQLAAQPAETDWAKVTSRHVSVLSMDEVKAKRAAGGSAGSPSSKIEGKVSETAKSASPGEDFLPLNADVNVLNTLSFRLDTSSGHASAFSGQQMRRAIENAVVAGLTRKNSQLPPLKVLIRSMQTDHEAGVINVDYQVKPEVLSSACRVDVADSVMDASDTMLEDSGDVKNFLSFVTSAIEDGAGPNGGGDTEALVAAAKAVSHVSQPKSTGGPSLLVTPQLETPHVLVRGSIKTGPVHRVLLESGAAQRAMAKVLRGLPDPVKVAGLPNDVRVVGYSVDKKTGDVSFCYEARVTGRTDDAAGEAALAYVEALGAGTGAYGGEQNPLQEAQFQARVAKGFAEAVEEQVEDRTSDGPGSPTSLMKLRGSPKLRGQLRGLRVHQVLAPSVSDDGGLRDAENAAVWRKTESAISDLAVNAVVELKGVNADEIAKDPLARRALEESLAELGLIDDDVDTIGTRCFDVRIMNVSDVVGGGARLAVQFHVNSSRCAEAGQVRSDKQAYSITSRLASKLKQRLAAAAGDPKDAARLKKLFRGNVQTLREAKSTAALLRANAKARGASSTSRTWQTLEQQLDDAFRAASTELSAGVEFSIAPSTGDNAGAAEDEEQEIVNWYSSAQGGLMTPDDTNLSSAKLGALRATFRKYDISGNGRLGVQELMMVLQNLGYDGDHGETARSVISKHAEDADGTGTNGHLTFQSFCRWKMEEEAARKAEQERQRSTIQGELVLDSSFAFDETSAHSEENLMKKRAFRVALAEIPYDLGLKTTKDNVIVDFKRQKDGTVRVGYSITLQDAGDDPDILAEIMTEVRDSIGKNGGQKFMQVLRRKAKTLATLESGPRKSNLDNWWDNKLGVRESTVDVQEDGSAFRHHGSRDASPQTVPESKTSGGGGAKKKGGFAGLSLSGIAQLKRKTNSLFKTLNGQIKLKGISLDDFEGSDLMVSSLKEAFSGIICKTGILRSDMRIKFDPQEAANSDPSSSRLSVGYRVRLRGDSRLFAEAVVDQLKVTFKDKERRNAFLDSFWEHAGIPRPVEMKHSKSSKHDKKEKREKKEKKHKRTSKKGSDSRDGSPRHSKKKGGSSNDTASDKTVSNAQRMLG